MASALLLTAPPLLRSKETHLKGISCHGEVTFNRCFTRRGFSNTGGRRRFSVAAEFKRTVRRIETVIPDPDFRIPLVMIGIAGGLAAYTNNPLPAAPVGLLGVYLMTTRVRFIFDKEAMELTVGDELDFFGENVYIGGRIDGSTQHLSTGSFGGRISPF